MGGRHGTLDRVMERIMMMDRIHGAELEAGVSSRARADRNTGSRAGNGVGQDTGYTRGSEGSWCPPSAQPEEGE